MLPRQCNACKCLVTAAVLLLMAAAVPASAADDPCGAAPYRQFDFWVGEWEVSAPDGRRAGHNSITVEQGGCLLVERWQGVEGSTGMSMNFYQPLEQSWRQVWVSPGVEIDVTGGLADGSMVLEGTIVYLKDDRSRGFRGTWTPLEAGRVRQLFEEANEDGEWAPWFEGIYSPLEETAGAP